MPGAFPEFAFPGSPCIKQPFPGAAGHSQAADNREEGPPDHRRLPDPCVRPASLSPWNTGSPQISHFRNALKDKPSQTANAAFALEQVFPL